MRCKELCVQYSLVWAQIWLEIEMIQKYDVVLSQEKVKSLDTVLNNNNLEVQFVV